MKKEVVMNLVGRGKVRVERWGEETRERKREREVEVERKTRMRGKKIGQRLLG